MAHLLYLTLQLFLLCLCDTEAFSDKNVLKFQVQKKLETSQTTTYKITANLSSSLHVCDLSFLSVGLGSSHTSRLFETEKSINVASALSPCEIRLGGTSADFLLFDPTKSDDETAEQVADLSRDELDSGHFHSVNAYSNYTLTGTRWETFNRFLSKVGWDLLFDVNLFMWRSDGLWDSKNAELLLDYSSAKGIKIPFFQLGNEPNAFWGKFHFRVSPQLLLEDYRILKDLTSKYPMYASSRFCGPDVGFAVNLDSNARVYFSEFVQAGAYDVVDEYSLHHYYLDGKTAKESDFLSVSLLDSLKAMFVASLNITRSSPRPLPIRLTETASCYGGGAPGLSDRYIAGFLWLDKLGLSAQYGISRVFRQVIIGGASYSLLKSNFDPTPDYYLSVLFKRLIEGPVFNVSADPFNSNLRVYAHCARRGTYSAGALTVYYLNLNESTVLSFNQFPDFDLDLYLLTPGDDNVLTSSLVKLNGNTLRMNGTALPPMPPLPYRGDVAVAATSFGFIVIPHANVPLCVDYYANLDSKRNNEDW